MGILFTRKEWELNPLIRFTKEQLDKAEQDKDGFIGYFDGEGCYLWRTI